MYEYINGTLTSIQPNYIVLENHGIGYRLNVPNPYQLQSQINSDLTIFVEQVVREDAHTLYGFETLEEKQLFLHLNTVKNIGPRTAMSILAVNDHDGLIQAIHQKNITYLTKFPGIGKRTAQQMLLDLEGKLDYLSSPASPYHEEEKSTVDDAIHQEALEALSGLGYSKRELNRVEKAFKQEEFDSTQAALSFAFKLLVK